MAAGEITIGLDLGRQQDPSAIAIIQAVETGEPRRDPVTYEWKRDRVMRLRHLERIALGTPYPEVIEHVRRLLRIPILKDCPLVVDATGGGIPVVDMLRAARLNCRLLPVTITGGSSESGNGSEYHVPKRDLITGLHVLFESGKFEMPASLPMTDHLIGELAGMRAKPSRSGYCRYEGSPDDLALALALAWWWARKRFIWDRPQGRVV